MPIAKPGPACVGVVDDDENLRRSFARLLRAAGMQPLTYASAEAFLNDPARPRFDCLVLDIHLPGMSGLQLFARLKAEENKTAVLFITAHDDRASRMEAFILGCAGYFHKSDSGRQVLNAIKGVITSRPGIP
jgi:FixJ family two-component response regulator